LSRFENYCKTDVLFVIPALLNIFNSDTWKWVYGGRATIVSKHHLNIMLFYQERKSDN